MSAPIVDVGRDLAIRRRTEANQALCNLWLQTPKGQQMRDENAPMIRDFVRDKFAGYYSVEALDAAADAILAARKAEANKVAAQAELTDHIQDYFKEHGIATDDIALDLIEELQRDNPAFNVDQFVVFAELNTHRFTPIAGRFKAFDLLALVRRADRQELVRLRQRYGDALVQNALDQLAARVHKGTQAAESVRQAEGVSNKNSSYTQADADADQRKRQEEFQKGPLYKLQQAQQKREVEGIVSSFRVCVGGGRTNWGDTFEGRQQLQQMLDEGVAAGKSWAVLRDELRLAANRLAGL